MRMLLPWFGTVPPGSYAGPITSLELCDLWEGCRPLRHAQGQAGAAAIVSLPAMHC